MNRERFEFLFRQYRNDRLLRDDWEEFQAAVRSGDFDSIINNEFIFLAEQDQIHKNWSQELEGDMWQEIKKNSVDSSDRQESAISIMPASHSAVKIKRLVAYAAVAASCALVFMLWRSGHGTPKQTIVSEKKKEKDINPGTNKAILTLANGSRIVLDSALNGQIAKLGNVTFHKSGGTLKLSFLSKPTGHEEPNETVITTPRGGQFELILPDGSKVWLNSASSLRFPSVFQGKQREVSLTGEGYFEIAANAKMPFVVSVNDMKVAVLGTHFNIMAYADEKAVNTTLLEGAVRVLEGQQVKQLKPGQQASLSHAENQLTVQQADLQKTIAWKNGLFQFDNTDLSTIMRQLARWYDIEIIYQAKPDNTALGGSISRNLNLNGVLSLLEANGINHFKIEGNKVIVLP
jgi:transmembrane sensor